MPGGPQIDDVAFTSSGARPGGDADYQILFRTNLRRRWLFDPAKEGNDRCRPLRERELIPTTYPKSIQGWTDSGRGSAELSLRYRQRTYTIALDSAKSEINKYQLISDPAIPGGLPIEVAVSEEPSNLIHIYQLPAGGGACRWLQTFHGQAAITSLGISPDQKYLVSGSVDGTVAIWPLGGYRKGSETMRRWGAEFRTEPSGELVIERLDPQGPFYNWSYREGDVLARIEWRDPRDTLDLPPRQESQTDLILDKLTSTEPIAPHQPITFHLTREGAALHPMQTAPRWHPLLMLYVHERDWIAWTPTGYYDASSSGFELVGWQFTRQLGVAPYFASAKQYYEKYRRPTLTPELLRTANLFDAAQRITAARPQPVSPKILPRVRIVEPASDNFVTSNPDLRITAEVEPPPGARLQSVRLLRNGTLHEELAAAGNQTTFQWTLRLDETNRQEFSVVATADSGSSSPEEAFVSVNWNRPASTTRGVAYAERMKKKLYVLAIGVHDYTVARESNPRLENLPLADKDAANIAGVFEDLAVPGIYAEVIPKQLSTAKDTTGDSIRDALRRHVALMQEKKIDGNDAVILYYAGHATWDEENNQFCLVPSDGNTAELMELLEQFCYRGDCKRLLILDTCHSGAAIEALDRRSNREDWSADIFASSAATEQSFQDERGGRFTLPVVDGLEGGVFGWGEPRDSGTFRREDQYNIFTTHLSSFLYDLHYRGKLSQKPVIKTTRGEPWPLTTTSFQTYKRRRAAAGGAN
jgi:hypothetical protein